MHSDKLVRQSRHRNLEGEFPSIEVSPSWVEENHHFPSEPVLKNYWLLLRRRKGTIVLFAAAVLILVGIASFLMTPQYVAVGRISVGKENSGLLGFKEGAVDYSGDNPDYNMYLEAQVHILQSSAVILQAAKELGWAKGRPQLDPNGHPETQSSEADTILVQQIQQRLDVSRVPRTPIIEIKYSNPDPRLGAAFVNGIMHAYVDQNFKTKYESAMQVSHWLTDELQELKAKVESSQQKQVEYQRQMGIQGVDEKENIVTAKLDELNRELTAAESDRLQKQAVYSNALSNDAELLPGIAENPVIQHLKQQQSETKSQYAKATTQLGPAHPKVLELKNELDQVNSALTSEINQVVERWHTAYRIALKREQMLHAALEAQKEEANRLNESAIQYTILKHDLQSNQQLYDGLLQKLKEAGVSAGLRSTNVRVIDYARVPIRPSKPNIRLNLAISLLLGCLGGAALAFVLEKLDDRLHTPDEVQVISALPPIAVIPQITSANGRQLRGQRVPGIAQSAKSGEKLGLLTYSQPRSLFAESYRSLRTSLLLSCPAPPKVILITSPLPSEGKTTISLNCAFVLAQKGARVLLVDADLRFPKIHQQLGLPSSPGLSTLLSSSPSVSPMDVIVQSAQLSGLFVLPAGPIPDQPAELLGSFQMKEMLSQWRNQFDHIVVDSAPVLSATDSVVLSVEADSVLLGIRSGQTPKTALVRARDLLLGVGARVTGVVVNGIDPSELGFGGYPYYAYGNSPSK